MKRFTVAALAALLMAGGCGKSAEEKQAEETAKNAEQAAQSAAKGLESLAKGLEQAAGGGSASGDEKPVDPVKFQDLIALLPEIDGWEKGKPEGERMTSPFPYSTAEGNYTKGDAQIEVKIVDSGFNQMLLLPYSMFLQTGYSKESSNGYEKSASIGGQPGWETWDSESKRATVNALVGKRFLVNVEGTNVEDTKPLQDAIGRMDLGKLASLK